MYVDQFFLQFLMEQYGTLSSHYRHSYHLYEDVLLGKNMIDRLAALNTWKVFLLAFNRCYAPITLKN